MSFFSNAILYMPELLLGVFICILLLYNSILFKIEFVEIKKNSTLGSLNHWASIQILFFSLALFCNYSSLNKISSFELLVNDSFNQKLKFILIFSSFFVLLMSKTYIQKKRLTSFEFYILFLLSILGILFSLNSFDFIILYVSLELQTLAFYILAAFKRNSTFSTEAGLKYFISGGIASGFFLFGTSLIYGFNGSTSFEVLHSFQIIGKFSNFFSLLGLFFVLVSLSFKLAIAPWHMWAPDVYEGSPSPVSFFFAISAKISLLGVIIRILYGSFFNDLFFWGPFLIIVGLCSILFAIFGAFNQKKVKRFLAFSSISHLGFIYIGLSSGSFIALESFVFYLLSYLVITFLIWLFLLSSQEYSKKNSFIYLDQLEVLAKEYKAYFFCLTCLLFSIAGIPPFIGFYAKANIFFTCVESSHYFPLFFLVLFSVGSAYYYIQVVKFQSFFVIKKYSKLLYKTNFFIDRTQAFTFSFAFIFLIFNSINPSFLYIFSKQISIGFFVLCLSSSVVRARD